MTAGETNALPTTLDAATGAMLPADFLLHANVLMSTATQIVTLVIVACEPSIAPERIRDLVQRLTPLGAVGKLGPRASLRVIASTQRAIRLAVLVIDQEQHLIARAVTAALRAGSVAAEPDAPRFTAAIYALCVPTTFGQLRSDAEALLEHALENGQIIETNQFADRAPPPALNAPAFRDAASTVGTHSVRGHALLFRFCQHPQPTHWIRVHTDGDLEFHDINSDGATDVVAVPRLIEPGQLVAIANAWRSFICHAEALALCDAATADAATATAAATTNDGTHYWLEAFTHGTRGCAAGVVPTTTAVASLLATITTAVAAKRNPS